MTAEVIQGDCLEVMRGLADASVDAIVCDPPYGLGFMGKAWDTFAETPNEARWNKRERNLKCEATEYGATGVTFAAPNPRCAKCNRVRNGTPKHVCQCPDFTPAARENRQAQRFQAFMTEWAAECYRVAKPGAHLVAFGGSRTYHRLACAIEDAGWEIRDTLMWLYGSGFPKSHNGPWGGTALKPAHEPIVLARKPLAGTVAATVAQYGTGALNIDGCRIEGGERPHIERRNDKSLDGDVYGSGINGSRSLGTFTAGRWPANVVLGCACAGAAHDPACAVALLDAQSGVLKAGTAAAPEGCDILGARASYTKARDFGGDTGGASRFYYCAKASRREREAGLEGLPEGAKRILNGGIPSAVNSDPRGMSGGGERTARNTHPTVKPVALMRWLCRLVTPAGGRILDPFCGSGSTGCAAVAEGFRFVGIEREAEYVEIARRRIAAAQTQPQLAA